MRCGKPNSFRFDEELEKKVQAYLKMNSVKLNTLINLAVEKFISESNTIEMKPLPKNWEPSEDDNDGECKKHNKKKDKEEECH